MTVDTTRTAWRCDRGEDGIWTLWFDQPGKSHNILTADAFNELDDRLAEIEEDDSVRGVLIRSAKEAGFCAGADLRTIQQSRSAADVEAYLRRGIEVFDRLARLDPPTTAVLHGVCLGGGFELALACQHRAALASHTALQLGTPEVHLGLIPGWGAIEHLTRLLAPKDALDLLLYGNPIGFLHAKSQGAVDRLVSHDEPERLTETLTLAPAPERPFLAEIWNDELDFARAKLAQQPVGFPEAQAAILEVIEIDLAEGPEAAREATIERLVELMLSEPSRHAIDEFFHRARG
ncbi:enoyl-CoA hydratase-related protein [Paludisphaera borealis]|uniref:Fatty acid oxidation complex subunit alpha n=1 Tax=Paludisphaera borealis TaxID=1387353 RepID=A0A1U7CVN1_9BACT|nr:enoyl-CoA hydratase-related protein [Paludisphaera borealis]APW63007.1 Fatty acid oxidation complex subunit alpha [Paludisphaera borealis]